MLCTSKSEKGYSLCFLFESVGRRKLEAQHKLFLEFGIILQLLMSSINSAKIVPVPWEINTYHSGTVSKCMNFS